MELNELSIGSPVSSVMSQDSHDFTDIDDKHKVCPVCSQEIRLYFINLEEKIRMCTNLECDYPFGYESIEILKAAGGQITELTCSQKSGFSNSVQSSVSTAGFNDVEKLCAVMTMEPVVGLDLDKEKRCKLRPKTEADKKREEIRRNVEKIRELTMSTAKPKDKAVIKNEKWLRNLSYLQKVSGINLMKPEEMKNMKANVTPVLQSGELKIDIDKDSSGVKIAIQNPAMADVNSS